MKKERESVRNEFRISNGESELGWPLLKMYAAICLIRRNNHRNRSIHIACCIHTEIVEYTNWSIHTEIEVYTQRLKCTHRDCSIHSERAWFKQSLDKLNTLDLCKARAFLKRQKIFLFYKTMFLVQLILNLQWIKPVWFRLVPARDHDLSMCTILWSLWD